MWRHYHLAALVPVLLGLVAAQSCGVSPPTDYRVRAAVAELASEWRQDDCEAIYNQANPTFRKLQSLDDWKRYKRSIDERFGPLQQIRIDEIDRIVPARGLYRAQTQIIYQKGATEGSLTFDAENPGGKPTLIGAILVDYSPKR